MSPLRDLYSDLDEWFASNIKEFLENLGIELWYFLRIPDKEAPIEEFYKEQHIYAENQFIYRPVLGIVKENPDSRILTNWGIQEARDIELVISIPSFKQKFGEKLYPARGDYVEIPGTRKFIKSKKKEYHEVGRKFFEVVDVVFPYQTLHDSPIALLFCLYERRIERIFLQPSPPPK